MSPPITLQVASTAGQKEKITEKSRLSSSRNSPEPLTLQAQLEQFFCDYTPKSEEATTRETVGSDSRRAPGVWCSSGKHYRPKEPRTGVARGDIADPNAQRGYRRVGTVGVDSFSGAARAAFYELPPASEEDQTRETSASDSHYAPEAWCSRKGTLQAQRAEDWCCHKGTLHTHKCPTRLPTGWHRRFLPFFGRS